MAKSMYTAVAGNEHSISIYDVQTGSFERSIFVTSGKIIGQPLVSASTITVTYNEGGNNWMSVFDADSFSLIRKQELS
jgi:hypothetical protein